MKMLAHYLLAPTLAVTLALPVFADDPAPAPRKRPAQPDPSVAPPIPTSEPAKPADKPTDKPADKPVDSPKPSSPGNTPRPTTPAKPVPLPAAAPKPNAPLPMVKKELVEPGPYVQRTNPKDLIFRARVTIEGIRWNEAIANPNGGPAVQVPRMEEIAFDQAWIVFPLIRQTASSRMPEETWKGQFRIGDRIATEEVQLMNGLHSGSRYAKMAIGSGKAKTFTFEIEEQTTAFRTKFLDVEAANVPWPKGGWPSAAASCFAPQMYIDYWPDEATGMAPANSPTSEVAALVNTWLADARIASPRDAAPVEIAKFLAGQVVRAFQIANQSLITGRNGTLEGVNVQPMSETIRTRKGSEYDLCHLLVACYRQAGLPARLVIGYQREGSGKTFLTAKGTSAAIRPYVEWCLFDEDFEATKASVNWIPVDIVSMRRSMPQPPPLNKPWRFFGTIDDLDDCFPFAFHLHPPTSVRAYGSPGFWGWMLAPTQPLSAQQSLSFSVTSAPVGGDNRKRPNSGD